MDEAEELKRQWFDLDEQEIDNAVADLVESASGRKFLWWLLTIGKIGSQPFTGNALQTSFNCGELNVGQRILDRLIVVSPDGYILMMKENEDERRTRDAELERAGNAGNAPGGNTA